MRLLSRFKRPAQGNSTKMRSRRSRLNLARSAARAASHSTTKVSIKDFTTIIISTLALFVAGLTAYFNFVWANETVSVLYTGGLR